MFIRVYFGDVFILPKLCLCIFETLRKIMCPNALPIYSSLLLKLYNISHSSILSYSTLSHKILVFWCSYVFSLYILYSINLNYVYNFYLLYGYRISNYQDLWLDIQSFANLLLIIPISFNMIKLIRLNIASNRDVLRWYLSCKPPDYHQVGGQWGAPLVPCIYSFLSKSHHGQTAIFKISEVLCKYFLTKLSYGHVFGYWYRSL